jgi:hypothetical protein
MSPSSTPMIRVCIHSSVGCAVGCACSVEHMRSRMGYVDGDRVVVAHSGWR